MRVRRGYDSKSLVYGVVDDGLVFIPKERATQLIWIWEAIFGSKTWGEFRNSIPPEDWEELLEMLSEYSGERLTFDQFRELELADDPSLNPDELHARFRKLRIGMRLPFDDDLFERANTPYLEEGDWPEWPAQQMLRWIPNDIQKKFGKVDFSGVSGDMLFVEPRVAPQMVAALEKQGFSAYRDDELVNRASGTIG